MTPEPTKTPKRRADIIVDRLELLCITLGFVFIGLFAANANGYDVDTLTQITGLVFCLSIIIKNIIWFRHCRGERRAPDTSDMSETNKTTGGQP